MVISACYPGDTVPPCKLGCTAATIVSKKEQYVFDACMEIIQKRLGDHLTFDGHPVNVAYKKSHESKEYKSSRNEDYNKILQLTHTAIENNEDCKTLFNEWKQILRHVDFRKFAAIFMPCDQEDCDWIQCKTKVSKAPRWRELLRLFKKVLPSPVPWNDQHYMSFLQLLEAVQGDDPPDLPPPDYHCPSLVGCDHPLKCTRQDEKCSVSITMLSKTAFERHDKLFH